MAKVNTKIQCLATLFIPTGLYAFKRVNKFKHGVLIYVTVFIYAILISTVSVIFFDELGNFGFITGTSAYVITFLVPILYINKWSNEYNKEIEKAQLV